MRFGGHEGAGIITQSLDQKPPPLIVIIDYKY